MLERAEVYDLDGIATLLEEEPGRWLLEDIPHVAPPDEGSEVLADFEVPWDALERVEELRSGGATAQAEEWLFDIGQQPLPVRWGGIFRDAEAPGRAFDGRRLNGWELGAIESIKAQASDARVYHCSLNSRSATDEGTGGFTLIYGVGRGGTSVGRPEVLRPMEDPGLLEPTEREILREAAQAVLMPFVMAFCLLSCKNVGVRHVRPNEDAASSPYRVPVIEPLHYRRGREEESKLLPATTRPQAGTFVELSKQAPLGEGLYWAVL